MRIGAWDHLAQLQFIMFKIFTYEICKQKQYKNKYTHQFRKKKNSKNLNNLICSQLTKAKSNFNFNSNIYIYILPRFIYIGLLVFNIELTHLAQRLKNFRLDGTRDAKLNSNFFFFWGKKLNSN